MEMLVVSAVSLRGRKDPKDGTRGREGLRFGEEEDARSVIVGCGGDCWG